MLSATGEIAEALASLSQSIRVWEGLIRKHPDPEFRVGLGQAYSNFGGNIGPAGRLDEAIDTIRKAVDVLEAVVRENDTVPLYRQKLGHSLISSGRCISIALPTARLRREESLSKSPGRRRTPGERESSGFPVQSASQVLDDLGHLLAQDGRRDAEARLCFETALKRAKNLTNAHYGGFSLAYSYRGLGKLFRKEKRRRTRWKPCKRPSRLARPFSLPPYSLYELACARALCSAVVGEGKAELTAAEQETKNRYADQAMEALHKAVAGGWKPVTWIKTDPDLDAIRSRADFQAQIRLLEDKQKTESKAVPENPTRQLRNTKGAAKN